MSLADEQAWALPVDIATFGAHLAAFITLRPTIETLRLCNRFGDAAQGITTLPIELIEHVEQYLLLDERAQERKRWIRDQACCEKLCEHIDHLDDDQLHERHQLYHAMQEAGDIEHSDEDRRCVVERRNEDSHSPEHIAMQYVKVKECLEHFEEHYTCDAIDEFIEGWLYICWYRRDAWRSRLSDVGSGLSGENISKVLRKDFGLEVRVVYGPWHTRQRGEEEYLERPTTAYLQLRVEERLFQWGPEVPVPADKKLARFLRAVKVLGLKVVAGPQEMDTLECPWKRQDEDERVGNIEQQPSLVRFSEFADSHAWRSSWRWEYRQDPQACDPYFAKADTHWMWAVVRY
ncbi:unnamed protein product [Zymoseptoria tritici ST99CH_1A5]|uniref:Uncharacterized protein n=1 Tax=Zymoseptoria tritici ST99CH_1A5 TaxID=1276529 RepID=A0A1Y6L4K8_ZYMTR|nr:unnamed protein product [Zymoseptoria tritici ST99CH_1A5]